MLASKEALAGNGRAPPEVLFPPITVAGRTDPKQTRPLGSDLDAVAERELEERCASLIRDGDAMTQCNVPCVDYVCGHHPACRNDGFGSSYIQ